MVKADSLQRLPYFAGLGEAERMQLAERCSDQRFEKGALVVQEGGPCAGLSFVIEGHVKVFKVSTEGREQILRVMGPGETFNDVPAFDGESSPASVQAMELSVIGLVPSDLLEEVLRDHPAVARNMLRIFAGRLRAFVELVSELSMMSVEARVARLLLVSSQQGSGADKALRITQQDMAAMVGTTREVAARALRSLEERGAIARQDGHIEIRSGSILAAVSEGMGQR